ncbi:universal stress protein [Haloferax larsenii]|uniref:Nucleotide-binding universal stress protein, UspA family n=1 Tax=Haloferax larsenii TaxID=302484 RepID=A0A1H7PGN6_HALLR|nr:universal stress protein [Haloferax larsenii]SEL34614.1 Nucleotide-binding universal stress protein, UspA family [Haloferax larsenii]
MFDKILLPIDDSTEKSHVLHHVSELSHWADATVRLLYVADTTRDSVTVVNRGVVDALEQKGKDIVEEATKTFDTLGVDCETDVVQGNPAPTIVEYADEYDFDLIVMPTHGRQGLARSVYGSVTEKVVRLSDRPVLAARMDPDETLKFPYERILLPTDGSEASKQAAAYGLDLAAALDARADILSVVDDSSLGPDIRSMVTSSEAERGANEAIEAVASEADERGVTDVGTHVVHGKPSAAIQEFVEENDVHAVVLGTTGKSGVDRILLGSVAEETVRTAPVPVITVSNRQP